MGRSHDRLRDRAPSHHRRPRDREGATRDRRRMAPLGDAPRRLVRCAPRRDPLPHLAIPAVGRARPMKELRVTSARIPAFTGNVESEPARRLRDCGRSERSGYHPTLWRAGRDQPGSKISLDSSWIACRRKLGLVSVVLCAGLVNRPIAEDCGSTLPSLSCSPRNLLPILVSLRCLVALWREAELYGVQEWLFCAWFVVALMMQLFAHRTESGSPGYLRRSFLLSVAEEENRRDLLSRGSAMGSRQEL